MGFALQSANVSRILSNLGADLHSLSFFWLAAPVMGLIVQPIVGAASDKTWNRFGRRGPYILGGAIVAALAMWMMPNAGSFVQFIPALVFGALMFALMDGSFNITMQPFRALVADMVPDEQRTLGYSVQSFLINVGAVVGSVLPFVLTNVLGVSNTAADGEVPSSVIWSFYIGGAILLLSVLWTVFKTKEYKPETYCEQNGLDYNEWIDDQGKKKSVGESIREFLLLMKNAPKTMIQLAVVQFFSWFALYLMWVYTTSAVSQHVWGTELTDFSSDKFQEAGNWVGVLFGAYSLFAALYSLIMPRLSRMFGRKTVYATSLILGGLGYISMYFFTSPNTLFISMIGIGIAWAAILAMPYSILSESLPADKMGVYMGIFNFTIAAPQIISGLIAGPVLRSIFHNESIYMIVVCGVCMFIAALGVATVKIPKRQAN